LDGNGANVRCDVIERRGIAGIRGERFFPLIERFLAVIDVVQKTAVGNAGLGVFRMVFQEILILAANSVEALPDANGKKFAFTGACP